MNAFPYLLCLSRRTVRAPYCTSNWHALGWLILAASNKGDLPSWKRYIFTCTATRWQNQYKTFYLTFSQCFLYIHSVQNELFFQNHFTYCISRINRCTAVKEHFDGGFTAYICWKTITWQHVIIFQSTLTAGHYMMHPHAAFQKFIMEDLLEKNDDNKSDTHPKCIWACNTQICGMSSIKLNNKQVSLVLM